ncbi:hypothetical protein PVK06_034871 [Gossypium arboreum]|uniref:CCHC-type domain-containing protein n=1 Tax=Gossypium arboreum TaxID=29729 RepID=A0ABR0NFE2_GOSAR|nr:hypothetical protein PVK06_034871 [Gossypium arboreum]
MDKGSRGRFACMVVYVHLDKPLVSHVLINGNLQNIEYESLLMVCFTCGRYGQLKESCSIVGNLVSPKNQTPSSDMVMTEVGVSIRIAVYGPWMVVEKKSRRKSSNLQNSRMVNQENKAMGSRFMALISTDKKKGDFSQEIKKSKEA